MGKSLLVSVAGVIGVGKTTLATLLADRLGAYMIHEEYANNPFLARQIAGDKQAGLASELYFLLGRARQLNKDNFSDGGWAVCDYVFEKNRIFAELSLDERQLAIYTEVERSVRLVIGSPRVVVYLRDTAENCLERIKGRARAYEQGIQMGWLARLGQAYDELFERWDICPVVRVDCAAEDTLDAEVLEKVAGEILALGE